MSVLFRENRRYGTDGRTDRRTDGRMDGETDRTTLNADPQRGPYNNGLIYHV